MVTDSSLRSAAEGGHAQMVAVKDNEGGKANVESVLMHTDKEIPRIPQSQQFYNFKEQLKEIDAAIYGDTAGATNPHHAKYVTGMVDMLPLSTCTSEGDWFN
uniref:Uncharacterized protein n=1 Tax=Quercus lobata TaxID=97700 RepID=A0A7N2L935_QUELO